VDSGKSKISLLAVTRTLGAHSRVAPCYKESPEIAGGMFLATVRMLDQPKETVAFEEARCGTSI
jgi:hypothetical protein